ncbi:TonB-dependent receptor [Oleiagrimonas sp. MCCC 1A03011]|uniref:TonB-dependent receptor n=1 Tax=Oleiagrimonas sp. MCCC 1A03011 TaxID=1926883 RepID=UPI000DC45AF1|nr:TonB-dependent receptor [Oleiagrimonas sp. MCCC 1A03011]RAP56222.1 Oar protein [Oleiagrimonas sp. MCCC 1A03011]
MNNRKLTGGALTRRNALTVALAVGLGFTGVAFGQATTGTIFGTAPSAAGQTVQVTGSGVSRKVTVGQNGRYTVSNLPVGTYTVTLTNNGEVVSTHNNVSIAVGSGTEVDFNTAANAQELSQVQVRANALPSIDVTSVNSSTVITASDLEKLPVGRSAESIALLSPGTVQGSGYFGNAVSFGGSSVAENAYYVNGYNTGEPYRNIGGFQLPYGSIAQQETLTGGFSAKYGRSDGGVISQVGKRGTNEWHFGGQIAWTPRFLRASPKSEYMPTQSLPAGFVHQAGYKPGLLNRYRANDKGWQTVYSAYVGGPLIKDKLFIFVAAEQTKNKYTSTSPRSLSQVAYYTTHTNKFYGKVDWNIDDNNVLEGTFLQSNYNGSDGTFGTGIGSAYNFDYNTLKSGTFNTPTTQSGDNAKIMIAHYTSYITDNATLSVLYGKGDFTNPTIYGNKSTLPLIGGGVSQNPAYWVGRNVDPNVGITNNQNRATSYADDASSRTKGLRIDFNYVLGDHNLGVGIDNMTYVAHNQGSFYSGGPGPAALVNPNGYPTDGTRWIYRTTRDGTYVAEYLNIESLTSMSMRQKAFYLQDEWQATPNLQLNLGVRNDHYTNYNNKGVAFVDEKNQWEPRLGFSWDVNGDSSFKLYGNAGRYYLALPNNAAERAANASTFVTQYFTYTGIDSNGVPTGLTPYAPYGSSLSSPDGEVGTAKDPKEVTAANLKAMYIDQYNLGFDKKLGDNWVYGAKLSYRDLKTSIDDECNPYAIAKKMGIINTDTYSDAAYYAILDSSYSDSLLGASYCRLINPGKTSIINLMRNDKSGYDQVAMSSSDWGYLQKPKRTIYSVNLYLEHPFDGKWFGRIDYTWTHARGNTAGQVRPDFGQSDVSKTEDWDSWQLMQGQDGELQNSRKHQIRIRGAYQLTPEWLVSGVALIQSGTPQSCLGYWGPDATGDPTHYNRGGTGNYHWCAGKIVHPGDSFAGHTPWTHQINVGVRYTPAFADHKLAFKLNVFNLLNEQKPVQTEPSFVAAPKTKYNYYHYPLFREPPRYIRLSVSYDY